MKVASIRQKFFDFFRKRGHKIVSSAPIVVKDDPTLMFTNAGMNQFKDVFLGNETPVAKRVADTQKCLRVSGKHNDLEQVGHDTYHHTMFEMLGNWSFGDYFKQEAIEWAWELLTQEFGLQEDRLYVTIFEGDSSDNLNEDTEAYQYWANIVPKDRILKYGKDENFWEMGDTGPCGPCSEIHMDIRPDEDRKQKPGAELVNEDHPEVIEIWNLVFIEFNRYADGNLEALPDKHVDTGMGLERLTAIMQDKPSNYDTDVFQPLIRFLEGTFKVKYHENVKTDIALAVIADHARAISFTIADGQLPSNTGAGYVIRRILRRGIRYGYQYLGAKEPFIYQLIEVLADQFNEVFPEIQEQKDFVGKVIKEEEQTFLKTLDTGTKLFNKKLKTLEGQTLPGKFAFELYDTYGFPIDLTRLMAEEEGLEVDEKEFTQELQKQKERSKQAAATEASDWHIIDAETQSRFIGYDKTTAKVHITRYREVKTKKKNQYHLVFHQTPFYAESGGQVGDTGYIWNENEKIRILDTFKENKLIIHLAEKLPQNLEASFQAQIDENKRVLTTNNHTATHLMHAALKEVLGNHVDQKGSLVNENHLRFDFAHFAKVSNEELHKIESIVNRKIRENIPRKEERQVPLQEAINKGATALFGEKYDDYVRVITFDDHFSIELCGGTHVNATGQIGFFKITSESAVAAGIRRIEAITGPQAEEHVQERLSTLDQAKQLLKNPKNLPNAIENLQSENQELKKEIEQYQKEKIKNLRKELAHDIESIDGNVSLLAAEVDLDSPNTGKDLAFELKNNLPETIILLGAGFGRKANLWLVIPDHITQDQQLNAGALIKEIAEPIQGGGGGQPFFATAGGKSPEKIKDAVEKGKHLIKQAVGR